MWKRILWPLVLLAGGAACTSTDEPPAAPAGSPEAYAPEEVGPPTPPSSFAALAETGTGTAPVSNLAVRDKDKIVKEYERRMRVFLGAAVQRLEELQARCRKAIEAIPVPYKIQAVETELVEFYKDREDAFEKKVLDTAARFEKEMRQTLAYLEPQVWKIAFEVVGSEDMGTSYGSRTGIDDVDSVAEATLELLRFRSKLDGFQDEIEVYRHKRIGLDRLFKHDVEGKGRFSVFLSDSLHNFFRKDEDVAAVTVTYQRKGLDPSVPLEFRQAVRNLIVRGGTTRFDSRFHWDRTLGTEGGRPRLENSGTGEVVVVSKVFFPRLNMDSPHFDDFRDFTAVRDYETAVLNADTGEILDCVSWQLKWNISHFGCVAVEKGSPPVENREAPNIRRLLAAEGASFPGRRGKDTAGKEPPSAATKPAGVLPENVPPPK